MKKEYFSNSHKETSKQTTWLAAVEDKAEVMLFWSV